jgi:hypothetical protein
VTSRSPSWQQAFLAVSAVLGEPLDDALASLGGAGVIRPEDEAFVSGLRSASREVRARCIAQGVAAVASAIDAARLA